MAEAIGVWDAGEIGPEDAMRFDHGCGRPRSSATMPMAISVPMGLARVDRGGVHLVDGPVVGTTAACPEHVSIFVAPAPHFTAPDARPRTRWRSITAKTMATGTVATRAAAMT